jgi:hypothetical protein
MYHFCTYFDSNYLVRGLTLFRSLQATGCEFVLHVLALDEKVSDVVNRLDQPSIRAVGLPDLEAWDPRLLAAKSNRSVVEYYFTLSPGLPLYLMDKGEGIDLITYVDADLHFYASPEPLMAELGARSILITEHRYPDRLRDHEKYGRYNVQYQSFRRDEIGIKCLKRWHEQCLDWCYDRVEPDRYADQKYLDEWPALYDGALIVSDNKGAGVAPWNWSTARIVKTCDGARVGDRPLIFYHFHGVKLFGSHIISTGLLDWGMMPWRTRRWLYAGYVRELRRTRRWIQERTGVDIPLRDKIKRGKGIRVDTLAEIARKAWAQLMVVP